MCFGVCVCHRIGSSGSGYSNTTRVVVLDDSNGGFLEIVSSTKRSIAVDKVVVAHCLTAELFCLLVNRMRPIYDELVGKIDPSAPAGADEAEVVEPS